MTLTTILLIITAAAIVLTGVTYFWLKHKDSLVVSFLQNWTGALFLFSGYVKAVDPLGTAYKMEQYFAEFQATFADTALSFIAPMFPFLAEYAVGVSVFMIVLEIVLGLALIIGFRPKLTSWVFFLIVLFFTLLTGFTFMTGYVPSGVNFFSFSEWGPFAESNMKVTDCGCFGDFIKLEPFTSFLKDVAIMVPALIFLFATRVMHQLDTKETMITSTVLTFPAAPLMGSIIPAATALVFGACALLLKTMKAPAARALAIAILTVGTLVYCMSNYVWNIPGQDFRPFKVNTDVAAVKQAEMEAASAVQVIGYKMVNKADGTVKELSMDEFLASYKDYPEEAWEYNQLKSELSIKPTKISDFEMTDETGDDPIPAMLADDGYSFLIVAFKLKGEKGNWKPGYLDDWKEDIKPLTDAALAAGHKVYGLTKLNDPAAINDFRQTIGVDYPFWQGDDIMLKTIIRSNPGVVLMKDGVILGKWHHTKVPPFAEMDEIK
ncbi:DoxX family protein [Neolewinella aurantiaca]|uniref:DoxX family protein n=1 Tax=Neolewinella aurantiaca TaxID=2602767 RepID=A0A5C7FN76_9BACT|nr:DoxX family protein [Neolewinella aurantiaca]TXF87803.1 DoxX family protein [Neolewinella aurantiaca]